MAAGECGLQGALGDDYSHYLLLKGNADLLRRSQHRCLIQKHKGNAADL
jgi:hypothetical protein